MSQFTTSLPGSKVQLAPPTEMPGGEHNGRTNYEIGYSMMMFIFSAFDWKYPFLGNLFQKVNIVCSS